MPKLQYLTGCLVFCILATSCVCFPVTVYSQINEQSSLSLYDFFQTIRSDVAETACDHFTVANGAKQVEPPIASKDPLMDIVSQAQTKISSTEKALINVFIQNKYYFLSYQVITQVNSALQLSDPIQQSTNILAGKFNSIIFATPTSGYFSCMDSTLTKNYTGQFNYDNQGKQLTIQSLEVNYIASKLQTYYQGGVLNLIADFQSKSIGQIVFPATNKDTYTVGTSIKSACQLTGSYILGSQYSLQVCGNNIAGFTITAFYLDYQQNLVSTASFPVPDTASYDAIIQTKTINGVAYILSSSLISTQFLYSTTVQLNTSDGSLSIQVVILKTPDRLMSWQFNIQSEQLLVAMTDSDILGYNLEDQTLLFALPTYSQTDYQLEQVFSSFNTYYLIFGDSSTHVTVQYKVALPSISYTQLNTDMTCTLSVSNGLNQVVITAKALTDTTTVSLLDTSINSQNIQSGSSLDISLNLEGYVVGSNLSLQAPTLAADASFTGLTASISSMEKLTFDASKLASFSAVVSTQTSTLLLQRTSTDNPPINTIILSSISIDTTDPKQPATINQTCSTLKLGVITQSDINGFFSFTSTASDFYQIALPFSSSLTDDCSLPVLTTTCLKTNANSTPFLFTSDVLTSNVFTICGQVVTVYTYSLNGSTLKFNSQVIPILPQQNYVVSQMIAIQGTLIFTDNQTIVIYKYSVQYSNVPETTVITIPIANLQTVSAIQLYSDTYLAISSTTSTVYQLPYEDQATPLRTLNFNSYTPNFAITRAIYQTLDGSIDLCNEEYFVIQAQDKNANQALLIYRLNCVSAQNQLYKILPITTAPASPANIFSTVGYFGYIDTAKTPQFYSLSYYTTLSVTASVNTAVAFASQMYQAITGNIQISAATSLPLNFSFQRDVSAANAIINMSQQDVARLQTYFIPYPQLSQAQPISLNLDSSVSSNVFGWISKQKSVSALFVPSISSRLSIQDQTTADQAYFDVLPLIGKLYAYSLSTGIWIGNLNIAASQYGNCYLQKDSSQDSTDSTTNPNQITVKITFYGLCSDLTNKQQELIKITFTGTQTLSDLSIDFNCSPPVTATRAAPELESTFTLQKIQTDPQLGLFMLSKKNQNTLQSSFCLVKINSPAFTVDCDSASLLNSLSVLDVVYVPNLKINLFITASGTISTGFTMNPNSIVVADSVQSYQLSSLADINTIAPVEQPLQMGSSIRDNSIIISYDSMTIFELTVSQSQAPNPVVFNLSLLHIFYGEDSLVFTSFGIPVSTTETVFLAIQSATTSLYFLLYSGFYSSSATAAPIAQYQTMKDSAGQLLIDAQNINGNVKVFLSANSQLSYFVNKFPGNQSYLNQIAMTSTIQVSVAASESTNSYSGVAFYLQLDTTSYNSFNSIPVSVDITGSTTSQRILKALSYFMIIAISLIFG